MQPRHHVSSAAIELIKRFEGYRRSAARLPDGRWTIGYGHTRSAREGARIDEEDAAALLLYDLGEVSVVLNSVIFTPLTQNQFDALVSFAMNIGVEAFRGTSVLLRVNEGALLQAAAAIEMWRKADFEGERIVVDALVRRRAAEKALFLTPADGFVPTPTPVVRPRIDYGAGAVSVGEAVELTAPLEGENATVQREADVEAPESIAPFPTETAATSVGARLQAILDDLELTGAAEPAEPAPEAEPAPFSDEPPIVLPLPDPSAHARRQQEEAAEAQAAEAAAVETATPGLAEPVEPFPLADRIAQLQSRGPASYLPLGLMLAVGIVLLAVATFWFVHAHPTMGAMATSVIGWVLGLTGVGLLATSIYYLLEKIGEQNGD
jgi:lysozyme